VRREVCARGGADSRVGREPDLPHLRNPRPGAAANRPCGTDGPGRFRGDAIPVPLQRARGGGSFPLRRAGDVGTVRRGRLLPKCGFSFEPTVAAGSPPAPQGERRSVLIVEDTEFFLNLAARPCSAATTSSAHAPPARRSAFYATGAWTSWVLDLTLEHADDGLEVLGRGRSQGIPCLVFTGEGGVGAVGRGVAAAQGKGRDRSAAQGDEHRGAAPHEDQGPARPNVIQTRRSPDHPGGGRGAMGVEVLAPLIYTGHRPRRPRRAASRRSR